MAPIPSYEIAMNIQEIFDKVVEGEFYGPKSLNDFGDCIVTSRFMCVALSIADRHGAISRDEQILAKREVDEYLKSACEGCELNLEYALHLYGLPSDYQARLAIYKDWNNRPALEM